jgi:hypothetical protein
MIKSSLALSSVLVLACMALPAAAAGKVKTDCADEISKFCEGVEHGQGRVRKCLQEKIEEVSSACRTALETTGAGKNKNKDAGGAESGATAD